MPLHKFQENIQIINKKTHEFDNFLQYVKTKRMSPPKASIQFQQNIYQELHNPEDFYENKSQFKHQALKMPESHQASKSSCNFEMRKSYQINSLQSIHQDNVKNQHPEKFIVLKSINQLPSWLFENAKKKYSNQLKNANISEEQGKKSLKTKTNFQNSVDYFENKFQFTQRYLNQAYVLRKPEEQKLKNEFFDKSSCKPMRKVHFSFKEQPKNISFVCESPYFEKGRRKNSTKEFQRSSQVCINEYEYSYIPQQETQENQKKRKHCPKNQSKDRSKWQKNSDYRIRQSDKFKGIKSFPQSLKKRLDTASEQQPLSWFRKCIESGID